MREQAKKESKDMTKTKTTKPTPTTPPKPAVETPRLCGRRMTKMRVPVEGITSWKLNFGGLSALIIHEPEVGKKPWRWQLDAWTQPEAISGNARNCLDAVRGLEKLLKPIAESVRCVVESEP